MRPIISSRKHIVQRSPSTVAVTAIGLQTICEAVAPADVNLNTEVEEGTVVKAVYCQYWMTSDDAAQSSVMCILEKVPAGATAMTFAQSQALDSYPNKKNVLQTMQGLVSTTTGTPTPVIHGWFKIPKGKQRMGLGDKINLNFVGIANGATYCGVSIYKSYS